VEKLNKERRVAEGTRMRRDLLRKIGNTAAAALTRRERKDEGTWPMLERISRGAMYLLSRYAATYPPQRAGQLGRSTEQPGNYAY
jgi:hypothetical protein